VEAGRGGHAVSVWIVLPGNLTGITTSGLLLLWVRLNRAAPDWDDAWYQSNSLTLYDAWSAGGLAGLARQFLASLGFKAPLITALPLPFYSLSDVAEFVDCELLGTKAPTSDNVYYVKLCGSALRSPGPA
jgi:hypothetical protein